jgi:NAD kinase
MSEGAQRASTPRAVIVTRASRLEILLERHGTFGQAEFYLKSRGQSIEVLRAEHERLHSGLDLVKRLLPAEQRRTHVDRSELDRFLFAPDDLVLLVGQDGLVANAAKYLSGQLVIGINPDFEMFEGVLCPHHPDALPALLAFCGSQSGSGYAVERRSMALATREDGQQLLALNDIFIGHSSHQSARYRISYAGEQERQSSSGVICSTGTGSTGWARSIVMQRGLENEMPEPSDRLLAWFVREPWPSVSTGATLNFGYCSDHESLVIQSEMGSDGVIFADGIETDRLEFLEGQSVQLGLAGHTLNLVVPR